MMKLVKAMGAALILSLMLVALAGCNSGGPAEDAGESIDDTVDEAGDAVEDAGEDMDDTMDDMSRDDDY